MIQKRDNFPLFLCYNIVTMAKEKISQEQFHQYHEPVDFRDTWRIFKIMAEFVEGYHMLTDLKGEVTFFGSARAKPNTRHYKEAVRLGKLLGKRGHTVITGGGPGIMEAANKGASQTDAPSIGLNIQLPSEQVVNDYVEQSLGFKYFFTRKVMLTSPSQAFFFFPGGFGTLDEFFEVVDLIEIKRMARVPVVAVFSDYWQPLYDFLAEYSMKRIGSITKKDLNEIQIVDKAEDALDLTRGVKERPFFGELAPGEFVGDSAGSAGMDWKVFRIMAELVEGFEFVNKIKNDVTVIGTSHLGPETDYYKQAQELGTELGKEKYTVVTGGGPGVMEAANKGAFSVGARSIGLNMSFDHQVRTNPYVKESMSFFFPFTRKLILTAPSNAFVCFPGGFGTMHQTFELLVLMQTGKMGRIPVILFGKDFWGPMDKFIKQVVSKKYNAIEPGDTKLYQIVDTVEEAMRIIKKIPKTKK